MSPQEVFYAVSTPLSPILAACRVLRSAAFRTADDALRLHRWTDFPVGAAASRLHPGSPRRQLHWHESHGDHRSCGEVSIPRTYCWQDVYPSDRTARLPADPALR